MTQFLLRKSSFQAGISGFLGVPDRNQTFWGRAASDLPRGSGFSMDLKKKKERQDGLLMVVVFSAAPGERDRRDRCGDEPGDVSPAAIAGLRLQGRRGSAAPLGLGIVYGFF